MIIKQVNFKERKNALQIAPKRSAVIPTLEKDPPLLPLHKKIRRYRTKVSFWKISIDGNQYPISDSDLWVLI